MKGISDKQPWLSRIAGRFFQYWLPVIAWMALIFILSDQPQLPCYPTGVIDLLLKKLGHLTEYAVLAVLVQRALAQEGHAPLFLYCRACYLSSMLCQMNTISFSCQVATGIYGTLEWILLEQ